MPTEKDLTPREAEHGQRMIEIKVRFWTDDIAEGKGQIVPKHARGSGVVRATPNKAHGIDKAKAFPFNSMMELPAVIERVLLHHKIVLHKSRKEDTYRA